MFIGYLSSTLSQLSASLSSFRQLLRGQARVVAESYSLETAGHVSRLSLDAVAEEYWQEEKFADALELIKAVRQMDLVRPFVSPRGVRHWAVLLLARFLAASLLCFAIGVVLLLLFPELTRKDLGLVIIPLFAGLTVPFETLLARLKRDQRADELG
jgi:hypothetical protein